MQFEVLRKSHKKEIIIGACLFIILAIVLIVRFTFAKYELVKSIKIAEGTINYKVPDFKIMAMYKNDGNEDTEIDTMPTGEYIINEEKSYCTLDNTNKDTKAKIYTDTKGQHIISGLSKSSKCYLYFDKAKKVETALGTITVKLTPVDYNKTAQKTCEGVEVPCEETNGIYASNDNDGESYYYRGDVENNYLKFGGFWWRIIRINGDGSIRLIYDGTSAHQNGEVTTDSIIKNTAFNVSRDDNAYVGFKYAVGQLRGISEKSKALKELETWYTSNLASYATKIDTNAGFCGDRTPSTDDKISNGQGGTGNTTTYYVAVRMFYDVYPELKCPNSLDLYTQKLAKKGNNSLDYPVGLITADEANMASRAYLSNGQIYWTLSPSRYSGGNENAAYVMDIIENGRLSNGWATSNAGIRPVINLRSDVKLSGKGSISNPYIVS